MIKAVIFDMNGVIINDEHIHELAFAQTVLPYGINLLHQDYLQCCAGKTDKAGYTSISQKFGVSLPIDKLLEQKGQQYLELFPSSKQDYPGVISLIHSLSKQYRLALTSSSSRVEVELVTHVFDLTKYFEITVAGNDVHNGKPDPEPYVITAKQLNLSTSECLVIEDSKSGVISAKTAGCKCIGVTTTHSKIDLSQADIIVNDFISITNDLIGNL